MGKGDIMNEFAKLKWSIEDKILDVANLYNDVTTSDLQGIATVKSQEIVDLMKSEIQACTLKEKTNDKILKCIYEKFA